MHSPSGVPTFKGSFTPRTGIVGVPPLTPNLQDLWKSRRTRQFIGCSQRFLQMEVKKGNIRVVRLGKLIRFDPADVMEYVTARKQGGKNPVGEVKP